MIVIKKDNTEQEFDVNKVIIAVSKSAERCMHKFTEEEINKIKKTVFNMAEDYAKYHNDQIPISIMHSIAESALDEIDPAIAKSYRDYRNYKIDFCEMLDSVYRKSQSIRYIGDVSNANTDSSMISTQRSLIYGQLNKNLYQKFFLNKEELQAANDGYIYIHDMKDRLDGFNCVCRSTRFITSAGIRSFEDFNDGDEIKVLSHLGHWRKAVVHSYGMQELQAVTFSNTKEDRIVECTPDHRWILKDGTETTNLSVGMVVWKVSDQLAYDFGTEVWYVKNIMPLNKKEEVWCLEVEEDHSFVLEGGISTGNCCLADIGSIIKNGFEMGNVWYTEPKTLDVAFDVISDVTISAASQQYGNL